MSTEDRGNQDGRLTGSRNRMQSPSTALPEPTDPLMLIRGGLESMTYDARLSSCDPSKPRSRASGNNCSARALQNAARASSERRAPRRSSS